MLKGLTKEHTKTLYGIAILMMLYHHLYCLPIRLNTNYYSVLNINGFNLELKIAWFCKMCVAIYAFITGYGLFVSANRVNYSSFIMKLVKDYKYMFMNLRKFYTRYWIVFAIFIPIGITFYNLDSSLRVVLLNLSGISYSYNIEWWYILEYLKMLLLFPLVDCILVYINNRKMKKIIIAIIVFIAIGMILSTKYNFILNVMVTMRAWVFESYLMIFLSGIMFAKFDLFAKFCFILKKHAINENIVAAVLLIMIIVIRTMEADAPWYMSIDIIILPILIYSTITLLSSFKIGYSIQTVLKYFGKYSTFMWLTHTFFCYYYFQRFIVLSGISTFIYLELILVTLITSICLEKLNHGIDLGMVRANKWIRDRF